MHDVHYSGWESPLKEEYRIGQRVTVYYDPHDPSRNALTGFADLSLGSLGLVPVLLIGIAVLPFIIFEKRKLVVFQKSKHV